MDLSSGKPFMLMESTPSMTNWQEVSKLKRPRMHILSSLQAVAHGSDTVQYFQWRKSRGSSEKLHGAVVDHCGHENNRVFKEVSKLGEILSKIPDIIGSTVDAKVGFIFDWENRWAINDAKGPRNNGMKHYYSFWKNNIPVDIIDMEFDISKYKVIIAPMLYMLRAGIDDKIKEFVQNSGTLITTYWSGIVNENDLCYLDGFPGPLKEVLGIWSEEIDSLYDGEVNKVLVDDNNYKAIELSDLIHLETAQSLGEYQEDFYINRPALTVNNYGNGKAYYIAFRSEQDFLDDFYKTIIEESCLEHKLNNKNLSIQTRTNGKDSFIFVMNFTENSQELDLIDKNYTNMITGNTLSGKIKLDKYDVVILRE